MKNYYQKIITLLIIAMVGLSPTLAQSEKPDSQGKEFWLMFPANLGGATYTLFLSGGQATTGNVSIPGLGFSQNFSVTPGSITSVVLPASVAVSSNNVVESKGIRVTAQEEITVYGLNRQGFTTDAYLGLPSDILGTEYLSMGYRGNIGGGEYFAIVAPQNGTVVTIIPKINTSGGPAGVPYNITLNQGQTYQLKGQNSAVSLTGSSIVSNLPIAVFGGNVCGNVPPNSSACDHMVEQLFPVDTWGKNFLTVPLKTRNGDTFVLLASEDGTTIQVTGRPNVVLNRGDRAEYIQTARSAITADKPILVAQFSNGQSFDNVNADPFMMLIPPFEQYEGSYTVTTPGSGFSRNFINVISSNSGISSLTLNGVPVNPSLFLPIPGSTFSGAQIDVSLGTFNLNGAEPFGVFAYGFDNFDSYGYPGATTLAPIALISNLTAVPNQGPVIQGDQACVTATVTDQFGDALQGIRVDLNVTGANGVSTFGNTDANGQVVLCYTTVEFGTDNLEVTTGALSTNLTQEVIDRCLNETEPPVIDCPAPVVIAANASCEGIVPDLTSGLSVTDNCSDASEISLTQSPAPGTVFGTAVTVTIVATDAEGNSSDCQVEVSIEDQEAPSLTCPDDFSIAQDPLLCVGVLPDVTAQATASDNCSMVTLTQSPVAGTQVPLGLIPVTITATDDAGNSSSCIVSITVEDATPPAIACPIAPITLVANAACQALAPDIVSLVTADDCAMVTVAQDIPIGSPLGLGDQTITVTATDANGLLSTCSVLVTVIDETPPEIECPADIVVTSDPGECGAQVSIPGFDQACDTGQGDRISVLLLNADPSYSPDVRDKLVATGRFDAVDLFALNNSTPSLAFLQQYDAVMVWTNNSPANPATAGNVLAAYIDQGGAVISAVFNNASIPVAGNFNTDDYLILRPQSQTQGQRRTLGTVFDSNHPIMQGVTSFDGGSSSFRSTSNSLVPGSVRIADYDNGQPLIMIRENVGQANVRRVDLNFFPPSSDRRSDFWDSSTDGTLIMANALFWVANASGGTACANDNCGIVSVTNDFNNTADASGFYPVGTTEVSVTVEDGSGNTATCSFTVTVEDNEAPTVVGKDITVVLTANGTVTILPAEVVDTGSDNCDDVLYSLDRDTFDITDTQNSPVTVNLTGTDPSGNATTVPVLVTVLDPVPEVITQDITVYLDVNGDVTITPEDVDNGSNSVVGIAELALDISMFDCSNIGPNTVVLTATSTLGTAASAPALVTVADTISPVAICQDITIQLDDMGNATIAASDVDGGSADACGIAAIGIDVSTFDCTNVGTNDVTLTVTDVNGNSSSCVAVVTVLDEVPPVATCQDITIQLDAAGAANITPADIDNGSIDACGIASLSVSPANFSCANVGENEVTLTVTDVNGNTSTCTALVTVEDLVAPVVICQNITVQLDDNGLASITPEDIDGGSLDECGIASRTIDISEFDCSNTGANIVTLTVTDVNGNSASCPARVVVEDNVDPIIECPDDILVNTDPGACEAIVEYEIIASDNCGTTTTEFIANGGFETGDFTGWTVGNTGNGAFFINDGTLNPGGPRGALPPINGGFDIVSSQGGPGLHLVSQLFTVPVNVQNAVISWEDRIHNNAPVFSDPNQEFRVEVMDAAMNPVAEVYSTNPGDPLIQAGPNARTFDLTSVLQSLEGQPVCIRFTEQDNLSFFNVTLDDVSLVVESGNANVVQTAGLPSGSAFPVGTTTNTFEVTDASGNTAACSFDVTVEDNEAPIASCQDLQIELDEAGNATISAADVDAGSSDACGVASIAIDNDAFTCDNIGDNIVTLLVTDIYGNTSTCTSTVTVLDVVPPVVLAQDLTIDLNEIGQALISGEEVDAGSTDACGIASFGLSQSVFDCGNVGENTVTLTVTDNNGNVTTEEVVITVNDFVPPILEVADITLELDESGNVSIPSLDAQEVLFFEDFSADTPELGKTDLAQWNVTIGDVDIFFANQFGLPLSSNTADIAGNVNGAIETKDAIDLAPGSYRLSFLVLGNNGDARLNLQLGSLVNTDFTEFIGGTLERRDVDFVVETATSATIRFEEFGDEPFFSGSTIDDITLNRLGDGLVTYADDACGIAEISVDFPSFSCGQLGENIVTVTAIDNNGNETSAQATVTIEDNQAPEIIAPESFTVTGGGEDCGASVVLPTPTVIDNCGLTSLDITINGESAFDYVFVPAGGAIQQPRQVIFGPDGHLYVSNLVVSDGGQQEGQVLKYDGVTGEFIMEIGGPSGSTSIAFPRGIDFGADGNIYVASQNSGEVLRLDPNTGAVIDIFVPAGTGGLGQPTGLVFGPDGNLYVADRTSASVRKFDGASGAPLGEFVTGGSGGLAFPIGLTFGPDDNFYSTSLASNAIIRYDGTTGAFIDEFVPGDSPGINLPEDLEFGPDGNLYVSSFTGLVSKYDGATGAFIEEITSSGLTLQNAEGLTFGPDGHLYVSDLGGNRIVRYPFGEIHLPFGVNDITLSGADASGNTASASYTIEVNDDVPPEAICQNITIELDENGMASITPEDVDGGSFDNCTIESLEINRSEFDCSHVGPNRVVLTVTDVNGNESTCLAIVTVEDNIAPVFEPVADLLKPTQYKTHGRVVEYDLPVASDNCELAGPPTLISGIGSGGFFPLGTTVEEYSVTDVNGNVSTTSFEVTVTTDLGIVDFDLLSTGKYRKGKKGKRRECGEVIRPLKNRDVIDAADPETSSISVRANVSRKTGSVVFILDGEQVKTENYKPYTIAGDSKGRIFEFNFELGPHTLTAIPYTERNGQGEAGIPLTITFTVINTSAVTAFNLFETDKYGETRPMVDNEVIDVAGGYEFTIEALTDPEKVGSVLFILNGEKVSIDNEGIYTLANPKKSKGKYDHREAGKHKHGKDDKDDKRPKLDPFDWEAGDYTLTAIPFEDEDAIGTSGQSATINFTIVNSETVTSFAIVDEKKKKKYEQEVIMPLVDGGVVDIDDLRKKYRAIKAFTNPDEVGSVVFELDGEIVDIEDKEPYLTDIFEKLKCKDKKSKDKKKHKGKDKDDLSCVLGTHVLTATPYSDKDGEGVAGTALTITFEVIQGTATKELPDEITEEIGEVLLTAMEYQVYPNPTVDQLSVDILSGKEEGAQLSLVSLSGQVILSRELQLTIGANSVDFSLVELNIPVGIVMLQVTTESQGTFLRRVMKQ